MDETLKDAIIRILNKHSHSHYHDIADEICEEIRQRDLEELKHTTIDDVEVLDEM